MKTTFGMGRSGGLRRPARLALVAALLLAGRTSAQEKSEPGQTPYNVQVVLHIVENRFLTPLFQEQLQKDIGDRLQLALGKLGKVQVTRTHRLLADIEAEGLGPVLERWDELNETRTCFVLLEYAAGRCTLSVRQHDGWTGLATPLARQARINDLGRIASVAVELIRSDFGLVGTVQEAGDIVDLSVRGGELTDVSRWLQEGQVFAVCKVTREGDRLRSTRMPWTALEMNGTGAKGHVRCKLWRRFAADDLQPSPEVVAYRCLALPTARAPLRLRFLDDKTFAPQVGLAVHVLHPGEKEAALKRSADVSGLVAFKEEFKNLALVLLPRGSRAQLIPVNIVDDRTVVILVRSDAEAEDRAGLDYRVGQWNRRLLENVRLSTERLKDINQQIVVSFAEALETARDAGKSLAKEIDVLDQERQEIQRAAAKFKVPAELTPGEAMLAELRQRLEDMQTRTARYESALKEGGDASALGLKGVLEKARLHEDLAEFDQAISLYETLLKVSPELSKVREHVDKLKSRWQLKGEEHKWARDFVYQTWPKLAVFELEKRLEDARKAVKTLAGVGDELTPLRMMKANERHASNLQKKKEELDRDPTEDARNRSKILRRVARELIEIEQQARLAAGKKVK
ncbi:MAG: hypothetical protein U0793_02060 [Gemmataceae bacterium]